MATLSTGMLLVFLVCSAITVLAMLRVLTNVIEHETELHDLRNRVQELQYQQQLYLARISGQLGCEPEEDADADDFADKESPEAQNNQAAQDPAQSSDAPEGSPQEQDPSRADPATQRDRDGQKTATARDDTKLANAA